MNGTSSGNGLKIAMVGTRGVPAAYGGFETAVEEIGRRLVERGHRVVVYSRDRRGLKSHLGMQRVWLPSLKRKQLETLSHTALSVAHSAGLRRPDVAFVFNAANSPLLPFLRARRIPTVLHMDGLEWQRAKWGQGGRVYYRWSEQQGVRWADRLIADAPGIADYYAEEFGVKTDLLRYGAPILQELPGDGVAALGLHSGAYHLVVARFEPENHVLEIVRGYRRSTASLPLVVVGGAPYADGYIKRIRDAASGDVRVRLLGPIYDQDLLDQLYFHSATYVHGHSVGGTNPSLLRAMGAGAAVIAHDNVFNRELLREDGWYFRNESEAARSIEAAETAPTERARRSSRLHTRAQEDFTWASVAEGYEGLALQLASTGPGPRRKEARRRGLV